ncbi:MAG: tRNA(fMet)-specific endonuclease VapC [Acidobacteria bacterium OLB17]|nr:MAG: tRNA(fMet)-specific endonuclease VapC [Acidobacteria bacterium OLB17]MCZ2390636.1 PIN domain-containing protein [Acidobacteriota bacterium]
MSLTSLDSNVVLRLILNDVPEQSARAAAFVDKTSCYVTDVVVAECVFVLEKVYGLDRDRISELMSILFKLETVALSEDVMKRTFDLYRASRPLSFVDCYSVAEAMLNDLKVVSFDRALLKKCKPIAEEPK